jgi:hypothetical protein
MKSDLSRKQDRLRAQLKAAGDARSALEFLDLGDIANFDEDDEQTFTRPAYVWRGLALAHQALINADRGVTA